MGVRSRAGEDRPGPVYNEPHLLRKAHGSGIQVDGVVGRAQRRYGPGRIGVVAGGERRGLGVEVLL